MPVAPTPEVLLLTGSCGIGKTTLSNAWADARGGAAVHADDIHLWIRVQAIRRSRGYQEDLKLSVTLTAAQGLLAQGLSVALDNVWTPPALERLRTALAPLAPLRAVRLTCALPVNQARDQSRPTGRMGPRVAQLAAELEALTWPTWLAQLDTTHLTIAQSLAEIDRLPLIAAPQTR